MASEAELGKLQLKCQDITSWGTNSDATQKPAKIAIASLENFVSK